MMENYALVLMVRVLEQKCQKEIIKKIKPRCLFSWFWTNKQKKTAMYIFLSNRIGLAYKLQAYNIFTFVQKNKALKLYWSGCRVSLQQFLRRMLSRTLWKKFNLIILQEVFYIHLDVSMVNTIFFHYQEILLTGLSRFCLI